MINRGTSEWTIFYTNDTERLENHFKAGGTVEMLNGKGDTALWNCINEYATECLIIMLKHGAKPTEYDMKTAFRLERTEFVTEFLKYGYWPKIEHILDNSCKQEVTFALCKKTTLYILCIAKHSKQPMFHLWKIIARFLYSTKYEDIWLLSINS